MRFLGVLTSVCVLNKIESYDGVGYCTYGTLGIRNLSTIHFSTYLIVRVLVQK